MITLYDSDTGEALGDITAKQLKFLVDQMEEETSEDQDYYISLDTLDMFDEAGIDPELKKILIKALGDREDMEIYWVE
jgi:hypothetical protein